METYWKRRRNNREDHHTSEIGSKPNKILDSSVNLDSEDKRSDVNGRGRNSFSSVGSSPTTSDHLNERPTKKNSQKENKKHPYKKVRK